MLVLVLLMLLLAMAVPFVFVMAQQEGTAAASLDGEHARHTSRAGTDYALARLGQTHRLTEYGRWYGKSALDVSTVNDATRQPPYPQWLPPVYDNPYVDGYYECLADYSREIYGQNAGSDLFSGLRDQNGRKLFDTEDSLRQTLGVNVTDETGKVNLNAATPDLIGNLLGSGEVTEVGTPSGTLYDYINLSDASFLGDPDVKSANGLFGAGYVVIDGAIWSYATRRSNTLYGVNSEVTYAAPFGTALFKGGDTQPIQVGQVCTSVQAYKLAYWPVFGGSGTRLTSFNNLGETRDIARQEWMSNQGFPDYLEGLNPVQYQTLLMDATTVAPTLRFDGRWFYPHVVEAASIQPEGQGGPPINVIRLNFDNVVQPDYYVQGDPRSPFKNQANTMARGISAGQIVRIRHHNGAVSLGVTLRGNRNGFVSVATANMVTYQANEPVILEVAERACVNVNTASWKVLFACFRGLRPRGNNPIPPGISDITAGRLATAILERTRYNYQNPTAYAPFRDMNEFELFLRGLIQDGTDPARFLLASEVDSIMFMQRYPYAPQPMNTAQFCFESYDAFAIESLASRFAPNGARVASSRSKEWVLLGNDATARYHWNLFEQMGAEQRAPQGNILTLYGAGSLNDRPTGLIELPTVHYANSERWPTQRPFPRIAPRLNAQRLDLAALAPDNQNPAEDFFQNVANGRGDMLPGAFSFWFKPSWGPDMGTHYIFDSCDTEYSNRISVLWWNNRRRGFKLANKPSGLVFRIKDRTLEAAFTELRYELDPSQFRQGQWYHFTLAFKGTDASQAVLIIDGDSRAGTASNPTVPQVTPVTNHTFMANNGAWVSRTTVLLDDLEYTDFTTVNPQTTFDLRIDPQDHGAMPSFGVIKIGDEAIEYSGKDTYQLLTGIARGRRGTTPRFHPRGSIITVWGYTQQMGTFTQQPSPGAPPAVDFKPQFPHLPITTGMLQSAYGDKIVWRVARNGSANGQYEYPTTMGPDSGFPGSDSPTLALTLPLKDYSGMPQRGIAAVIGFAWTGYKNGGPTGKQYPDFEPPPPLGRDAADNLELPPNRPSFQDLEMEYVYYDGIGAQGLNVVARYDERMQLKQPTQYLHFLGEYDPVAINWAPSVAPNPLTPGYNLIQFFREGSVVLPVSLDVSNSGGYHAVSWVAVDEEWFFYNRKYPGSAPSEATAQLLAFIDDQPVKDAQLNWNPQNTIAQWVMGLAAANQPNPAPFPRFRAQGGTPWQFHNPATPVTPVFVVKAQTNNQAITVPPTGVGDVITLVKDVNSDKELHTIRQHRGVSFDHDNNPNTNQRAVYLASLVNHTLHDYFSNDPTWICKFPTGDLPVQIPVNFTFGGAQAGTADAGTGSHEGSFDSFEFRSYQKGPFQIVQSMTAAMPSEGQDIQVNTISGLPQNVGIIHVDDEFIAYRGTATRTQQITQTLPNGTTVTTTITTYWLTDITRGVIGSVPAAHAEGSGIMNMAALRLGRPAGNGFAPIDSRLMILPGEQALRDFGFVRIYEGNNYEVVGYQQYNAPRGQNPGEIIAGRYDPRTFQGPWRGVYGTQAQQFSARAIVLDQPVRFPDWGPSYCEQTAQNFQRGPGTAAAGLHCGISPEVSHVQGAAAFRNSIFEDIRWRISYAPWADATTQAQSLIARLVVRFDGQGEWSDIPTNAPGGLYSFDFNINGANTTDLGSGIYEQVDAFAPPNRPMPRFDRVEWRVYFLFMPGAFDREDYKISLQFHGCDIGLRQVSRVVRHEEQR